MGLGLIPLDYLTMLDEEYAEFQSQPLSMRKMINCCALANSLPEVIFEQYGKSHPSKVHNIKNRGKYRDYLRSLNEAHHIVRDLCDFSKHYSLTRGTVTVDRAARGKRSEGLFRGLLVLTQPAEVERLIVRFRDGTEKIADEILRDVSTSWRKIFSDDSL